MKLRYTVTLSFLIVFAALTVQAQIPNYTPNVVTALGPVNFPATAGAGPVFTVTAPTAWNSTNGKLVVTWNNSSAATRVRAVSMHGGLLYTGALVTGSGGGLLNTGNSYVQNFNNLKPGIYTFAVYSDINDDNVTTNNSGGGAVDDFNNTPAVSSTSDQNRSGVYSLVLLPATNGLTTMSAATTTLATSCLSNNGQITISGLSAGVSYDFATSVGGAFTTVVVPGTTHILTGLYPGIYPVMIRKTGENAYRLINVEVGVTAGVKCYTDNLNCSYSVASNAVANGNFGTAVATLPTNGVTDYTLSAFTIADQPQDSKYALVSSTYHPDNGITQTNSGLLRNFNFTGRDTHWWGAMQATKDHTGSTTSADGATNGKLMVVNAHYKQDRVVSVSNVNIVACREYEFSFWVKNLQPYFPRNKNNGTALATYQPILPRLGLVINGIIYTFQTVTANQQPADIATRTRINDQGWQKIGIRFKAPVSSATSTITIYNFQQGGFGNDFAIDDVFFAEVVNPLVFNGSASGTCGPTLSVNVNASTTCPQFGTPTYQWQLSTDNGGTYAAAGSTFSSIPNTITAGNTAGSVRYRLNIADGACSINTTPMYFNDIGSLCVLPVTGLEFSGKHTNSNAELRWDIQSEARIVRYELERSLDGKIFFQLA